MKQFRWLTALVVGAFLLAACGGMQAAVPEGQLSLSEVDPDVYDKWDSGSAASECSQIGEFEYAWKINELGGEGAPNVSEIANFYDLDNKLIHSNTITILNSDGKVFDWSSSPNGIGAVIVKAGTGANVWTYDPQAMSDTGLYGYDNKDVSHVTFCWNDGDIGIPSFVTVEKTADASFTRTYKWDIEKTGPESEEAIKLYYPDGTVDLDYFVTVGPNAVTPYVDSDFTVSGTITITNYSTTGLSVSIDDIRDDLGLVGFEDIEVDCGVVLPYTLVPGEENALVCTYSVTDDLLEGEDGVNWVYVDVSAVGLTDATLSDFDPWDFDGAEDETDVCIDVFDSNYISEHNEFGFLGTVCLADHEEEDAYTAPKTFEYPLTFDYTDFDECGLVLIDNTASFVTRDTETDGSDDWDVWINVQCADGETAWASNARDVYLVKRYTNRGNWATYVEYFGEEKVTTLYAGQTIDVGTVTFSAPVDGYITITVELTAADAAFEDVAENLKVQDYADAPSGNPSPGRFDHKKTCDFDSSTCTIVVDENNFYGVHVNVVNLYFVEE